VQRRSALESGPSRSSELTNPDRSVKRAAVGVTCPLSIDPIGVGYSMRDHPAVPRSIRAAAANTDFDPLVDHGTRDASRVISGTPAKARLTGHPALAARACSANAA
jgi:hypothetical protein